MRKISAYAAQSDISPLSPFSFERREVGSNDVQIEVLFCGVCHTDLHFVRNEWKNTLYPVVPGHEIVGRVTKVGASVLNFKEGDLAAVGCMVDSCRTCKCCKEHLEQYCEAGSTFTYNTLDKATNKVTYGGYSTQIVVKEDFVLHIPKGFTEKDLPGVAPLLCAGITTYSPLKHWNVGRGSRVGVVGLGGLGHMAIQIAHALGAYVVLFTTSPGKEADARRLGADEVVLSGNKEDMAKYTNSLDFILDTAAVQHNLDPYLQLLTRDGTLCLVGLPSLPHPSPSVSNFIFKRRSLSGSLIGGIQETQEMLYFCAEHHLKSYVEVIPIQKINEAYERMLKNDVHYRFVIDIASLRG
jgi:uncharacterized zinc-type alcohol dehydrogenase-like protein